MKWYKLIFKQNQPIHIGSVKWGVINETEIFIPGWTMWGALTNQFLRTIGFSEIERAKKLFEHITNFYPAVECEKVRCSNTDPLFPKYEKGDFYLGDYPEEKFKFEFVDTIVSTAIEPLLRSTKDESLHEFEFILPKSKQDISSSKQLYWIGLIGFEDDVIEKAKDFLKISLKIYIGGDSKYGFGELELFSLDELKSEGGNTPEEVKKWDLDEDGHLFLDDNDNSLILKHFFEFSHEVRFEGEVKLLAEFDFTQNNPKVENAGYFVNIGSQIIIDDKNILKNHQLFKGKLIKNR
ncbi:hypothetical protein TKV_c14600 [Thermoanaerobacter kivui]|uniref:CRISPR type III-associated protein domain-containing protein n=1 Tax=Thermoanaerobacter kivui TaxID=2325 RepID=A0A097AS46_THEKI|nr:RAMP superfamily CRISPR-associated protein [Thermoanaerobacter kivui]AIS52629.1 hypothetical protein TKV_c14600 [Thermoanaerobacter kivui]